MKSQPLQKIRQKIQDIENTISAFEDDLSNIGIDLECCEDELLDECFSESIKMEDARPSVDYGVGKGFHLVLYDRSTDEYAYEIPLSKLLRDCMELIVFDAEDDDSDEEENKKAALIRKLMAQLLDLAVKLENPFDRTNGDKP